MPSAFFTLRTSLAYVSGPYAELVDKKGRPTGEVAGDYTQDLRRADWFFSLDEAQIQRRMLADHARVSVRRHEWPDAEGATGQGEEEHDRQDDREEEQA